MSGLNRFNFAPRAVEAKKPLEVYVKYNPRTGTESGMLEENRMVVIRQENLDQTENVRLLNIGSLKADDKRTGELRVPQTRSQEMPITEP